MGWKSTLTISREEAISAIMSEMYKIDEKTNDEISSIMRDMFGDDSNKPYYGYNFDVVDEVEG